MNVRYIRELHCALLVDATGFGAQKSSIGAALKWLYYMGVPRYVQDNSESSRTGNLHLMYPAHQLLTPVAVDLLKADSGRERDTSINRCDHLADSTGRYASVATDRVSLRVADAQLDEQVQ